MSSFHTVAPSDCGAPVNSKLFWNKDISPRCADGVYMHQKGAVIWLGEQFQVIGLQMAPLDVKLWMN